MSKSQRATPLLYTGVGAALALGLRSLKGRRGRQTEAAAAARMTPAVVPEPLAASVRSGCEAETEATARGDPGGADRMSLSDASKLDLIQQSFKEVLDATKHQDEKIGRFLTAIAFLTTGAITLVFTGHLIAPRFDVGRTSSPGGGAYPLLAWATVAFFMCILASVMLLLLSLSTALHLQQGKKDSPLKDSRLFFGYISNDDDQRWEQRWREPSEAAIKRELLGSYIKETLNLSRRAQLKYAHTDEAAALFILSLMFLTSALVLAADVGLNSPKHTASLVVVTWPLRAVLGTILAGHAFLQLYVAYNKARQNLHGRGTYIYLSGNRKPTTVERRVSSTLALMLVLTPLWILAVICPSEYWPARRAGALVAFVLAALLATWLLVVSASWWTKTWRAVGALLLATAPAFALGAGGIWPIGLAALPPVLLSAHVAGRSFYREWERTRLVGKKAREAVRQAPASESGARAKWLGKLKRRI